MPTTRRRGKPTELENAGRTIRQAARIIEDKGWRRGTTGDDETGMCARGAIARVLIGSQSGYSTTIQRVEELFGRFLGYHFDKDEYFVVQMADGTPYVPVTIWNDRDERTQEEVLQWMHKFADEADPQLV